MELRRLVKISPSKAKSNNTNKIPFHQVNKRSCNNRREKITAAAKIMACLKVLLTWRKTTSSSFKIFQRTKKPITEKSPKMAKNRLA